VIRPDVVDAVIHAVGELRGEDFGPVLDAATPEEINTAVIRLRDAALTAGRPPDVLSFTLPQLARLAAQGHALEWIAEQFPAWRAWPGRSLSDQLKTAEPWRVAQVRDALQRCGLDTDQGASGSADDAGLSDQPGP
jgi:hypothetical protein